MSVLDTRASSGASRRRDHTAQNLLGAGPLGAGQAYVVARSTVRRDTNGRGVSLQHDAQLQPCHALWRCNTARSTAADESTPAILGYLT